MWVELLPYAQHLDVFALIVIGLLVEKRFVSRTSVFANTVAVNVHFYQNPPFEPLLVWYANIGLVFGAVAILAYATEESLPGTFYSLSWAYSAVVTAIVILVTL
jgi:hypothetical protein